jgi:putative hydrolase of the HAD superfamily
MQQDRRVQSVRNPLRPKPQAILLDAMGTLLRLEPPGPRLRHELLSATGTDVSEEVAERAFRAEIECYLARHLEGSDAAGLEELRDACAAAVAVELGGAVPDEAVRPAMLRALGFAAFEDAAPALTALRAAGLRLVVVSNWDCSLTAVLEELGLLALVDGVATSAAVGAAKPHAAPFLLGLGLAGTGPRETWMVGDSEVADVGGAEALGIHGLLLRREPEDARAAGTSPAISSLAELPSLI